MSTSSLSVGLAFLAGMLTVLSPCVLPILPILVGRSLQSHRYGAVALVAGLVGGFAVAGSLLGFTSQWIAGFASGLRTVAIAVLLLMVLLAMVPALSDRLFQRLRLPGLKEPERKGLWGEFWLGTQLGLLWTPCAGSVLGSIVVLAAAAAGCTGFWAAAGVWRGGEFATVGDRLLWSLCWALIPKTASL